MIFALYSYGRRLKVEVWSKIIEVYIIFCKVWAIPTSIRKSSINYKSSFCGLYRYFFHVVEVYSHRSIVQKTAFMLYIYTDFLRSMEYISISHIFISHLSMDHWSTVYLIVIRAVYSLHQGVFWKLPWLGISVVVGYTTESQLCGIHGATT